MATCGNPMTPETFVFRLCDLVSRLHYEKLWLKETIKKTNDETIQLAAQNDVAIAQNTFDKYFNQIDQNTAGFFTLMLFDDSEWTYK